LQSVVLLGMQLLCIWPARLAVVESCSSSLVVGVVTVAKKWSMRRSDVRLQTLPLERLPIQRNSQKPIPPLVVIADMHGWFFFPELINRSAIPGSHRESEGSRHGC
jgi:hypothetical protein